MNSTYLVIGVIVLFAFIVILLKMKNKEQETEQNYRALFIFGITWILLGVTTDNTIFWIMGIIFLIVGLVNRDKWKDIPVWSDLSPEKRKIKLLLIIGIIALLLAGLAFSILVR